MQKRSKPFMSLATALILALAGCSQESGKQQLLSSAKQYLQQQDYKAAGIQLKTLLQKTPEHAEARFLLGVALNHNNDPVAAEKELRRALALNYSANEVWPELGKALLEQGEFKKLLEQIRPELATTPQAKAALLTLIGRASLGTSDLTSASQYFIEAQKQQPNYTSAMLGEARVLAASKLFEPALAKTDTVLQLSPNLSEALLLKAGLQRAIGQTDAAIASYETVIKREDDVAARANLALLYVERGQLEVAKQHIDHLKKQHPDTLAAQFLQGLLAFRQKQYQAAHDALDIALTADPNHAPTLFLSAASDFALHAYPKAETKLLHLLQKQPSHYGAQRLLTATYLKQEKPAKAAGILPYILRPGMEDDSNLLALAGEVFQKNQDYATAERFFARASSLAPESVDKKTGLATARIALGKTDKGLAELAQASAANSRSGDVDLQLVQTLLQQRDFAKAQEAADRLAAKQPNSPLSANIQASVALAKGDIATARKQFEQALTIDPRYFPAALNLAYLDAQEKHAGQAEKRLTELLAKVPGQPETSAALSRLQAARGAPANDIIKHLEKSMQLFPAAPLPYMELAHFQMSRQQLADAAVTAQKGLKKFPNHAGLANLQADIQQLRGDLEGAINTLLRLASSTPTEAAPALQRTAKLQSQINKRLAAVQTLKQALRLQPNSPDIQLQLAQTYLADNQAAVAEAIVQQLLKASPKHPATLELEGDIHVIKHQYTEAESAYRKALDEQPSSSLAVKLAQTLQRNNRSKEYDQLIKTWLERHPNDPDMHFHLGDQAMRKGAYAIAEQQYRTVLLTQPRNALVLNNLALAQALSKNPTQALNSAEQALSIQPDNPEIMDTVGTLLTENLPNPRGVLLLEKATAARPQALDIRLHLAKAYLLAGRTGQAKTLLSSIASADKGSADSKEAAALLSSGK